jgi:hypothetical protein
MPKRKEPDVGRQPTNEEQMALRQSAPRPTATEADLIMAGAEAAGPAALQDMEPQPNAVSGYNVLQQVVKKEDVQKAGVTLLKYKQGKANLEHRIVTNEQWYKLRHWGEVKDRRGEVEPTSAWLLNAILNKHADALDNMPAPAILPREQDDEQEAKILTNVIPVILQQNDFEQVYSDVSLYKIKHGTGVYGVFWDKDKQNGLGDISVNRIDILNLFWEPGLTDIQRSPHLFAVELVDNEQLLGMYPQLAGKLSTPTIDVAKYVYDDSVDTSEKSVVVDWYYKKRVGGKTVLHYCKFVNDEILYASENDPELRERGWYDHGQYPFIFDTLYPVEGSPVGFGFLDIGKSAQIYIDRLGKSIMENALANSRPRFFSRNDGTINEKEFADISQDFVHVEGGQLGDDSIRPIEGKPLQSVYYEVLQGKIEELKETCGNRDVNTGGRPTGVTAASAVAALQEAGSKLSRANSRQAYRAYAGMVTMIIELIRQFYQVPRMFRIVGVNGAAEYVSYDNRRMQAQPFAMQFGIPELEAQLRTPTFDVEVSAQRASAYSKLSQNELALQFYGAGLFNPAMADQALLCLDMMDFDRKDDIRQKVAQNGMMYQQAMAAAAAMGMAPGGAPMGGQAQAPKEDTAASGTGDGESPVTKKARQEAAERTMPR